MNIFDWFKVEKEATEKNIEIQNSISIEVDRDSVCMGDDCFSHRTNLTLPESTNLLQLLKRLADYVPTMKNVIWAVRSDVGMCGYIITDADSNAAFELCGANMLVTEMNISEVMCKYYYPSVFSYTNGKDGKQIEKHPECRTFLEKVKKDNESAGF